jgi:hypothetical protein
MCILQAPTPTPHRCLLLITYSRLLYLHNNEALILSTAYVSKLRVNLQIESDQKTILHSSILVSYIELLTYSVAYAARLLLRLLRIFLYVCIK